MRVLAVPAMTLALAACGAPDATPRTDQPSADEANALNAAAAMLDDTAYPPRADETNRSAKMASPALPPAE